MRKRLLVLSALLLVFSACSSGTSDESTTTTADDAPATTTPEEVESSTTEPAPAASSTTTPPPADTSTTQSVGGEGAIPDPSSGATLFPYADENITTGDVFIYWYREAGGSNYLALYTGPGIAGSTGQALCPGNSILVIPDYLDVSNTPVEDGSCEGFPTETASVQVCSGDVWIYRTAIPGDTQGNLIGSLEWNSASGGIKGLTSGFDSSQEIGEFEFGLATYTLWDGFTSDGSSQITCDAPMS